MNNATHESSSHVVPTPDRSNADASEEEATDDRQHTEHFTEVTAQLNQIRFSPRAATIRAIMKYAHRQDEAVP